jgi:DNA-binding PadR family transcriptional regulator
LSNDLSFFSYEVMGLVGREGASPHDLKQMVERGRMFAWAGESQYYSEPKRLAKLGYLEARKEPGKTRPRTVYSLTDKGLEALREYAARPVTFTPVKSDLLVRLLIADLVDEPVTRESVSQLRGDLADLDERLREFEARSESLPHRRKYRILVLEYMQELLELQLRMVRRVERELDDA